MEDIFPDNFTRREIHQLRKSCPFATNGCKVTVSPLELDSHALICSFKKDEANFVCTFKKCGCKYEVNNNVALTKHIEESYQEHLNVSF